MLQTLTATYLRLKGHSEIENGGFVLTFWGSRPGRAGRCLYEICQRQSLSTQAGERRLIVSRGTKEPFYTLNIIDGTMSVSEVMQVAKSYNATITEYLNSVLLYALMQKQESEWHLKLRPVKLPCR